MKVAERMRRDGWHGPCMEMWFHCIDGIELTIWPNDPDPIYGCESTIVFNSYTGDESSLYFGAIGLRDLAQRAKAAARRLARKGKR